jgi:hypothetical protein
MRVQVIKEVTDHAVSRWTLCFQWCNYVYDDGSILQGYRFIWRRPNGNMQPARGQARLLSVSQISRLIAKAKAAGWANNMASP